MNLETVLKIYGKTDRCSVLTDLSDLGNDLFGNDWDFTKTVRSSTRLTPLSGQYHVRIGSECLTYGCTERELTRAGYVLAVEHMYHEYRHVQQLTSEPFVICDGKMTTNDRRMTDIVRRGFVADFYKSAYTHNYKTDPGEIDAEVYGLQKALEYFGSGSAITKADAKDILFQIMMADNYGHKEQIEQYGAESADDMMSAFVRFRDDAVHIPYSITTSISPMFSGYETPIFDMTEEFLRLPEYKTHRKELEKCTDGRIEDKILEQAILQKYPDIAMSIPRLQKELAECQKSMDSRPFVAKNRVIPASKIYYTNTPESPDVFESAEVVQQFAENIAKISGMDKPLNL